MNSSFLSLNKKDLINGAINATVAAVIVGLYGIVVKNGFDLFALDYSNLFHMIVNWAFVGFISSVGKNLLTTDEGKIFGIAVK